MIVGVIHDCTVAQAIERQRASAEWCDAFEVRLDTLTDRWIEGDTADWSRLFAKAGRPCIATCRHHTQGGRFEGDAEMQQLELQMAVAAGARWVDLELLAEFDVERDPAVTQVIRSVHQFAGPVPSIDKLLALAEHARHLGAEVFKFAFLAHSIADNLLVREVANRAPLPVVGIAMGELGAPSRIAYKALGSRWTYGPLPGESGVAPGQIDVRLLRRRYRAHTLDADTRYFGVLGNPVAHSRGVRLHNAAFVKRPELDACYLPLLAESIEAFWRFARGLPLQGFSVTSPYKTAVLAGLDNVAEDARPLHAVNTVVRRKNQWLGSNTDLPGAFEPLEQAIGGAERLRGCQALILGAGGSARVIAAGLLQRGAHVAVLNRTQRHADELAEALKPIGEVRVWPTAKPLAELPPLGLLVNTTTVGMAPNVEAVPLDLRAAMATGLRFTPGAWVFDLIYNPAPTRWLADAAALGLRTLDGGAMYRRQAELQFATWHPGATLPADSDLEEI